MKIERSGKTRKAENIKSRSTQKTKIQADKLKLSAACANNRPTKPNPFSDQHSTQWRPLDHLLHLAEYTLEKKGKTAQTKLRAQFYLTGAAKTVKRPQVKAPKFHFPRAKNV